MGFGDRLAAARKNSGLTQGELGRGLGTDGADVGKSVVYGWEKDQHHPRVDQLALICKRLNCSADYLLLGEEAEWPFAIPRKRYADLSETDKGFVAGKLEAAIEACEQRSAEEAKRFVERRSTSIHTNVPNVGSKKRHK